MTFPKVSHNEKLEELAGLDIGDRVFNALLSDYSSWQIGGPADLLVEPASALQVATVIVVTILVVNSQQLQVLLLKFPATLGAYPAVNFKGFLAIIL